MTLYAHEHERMLPVVREAGAQVMRYFTNRAYLVAYKDAENPVTDADFAAHRVLVEAIGALFPEDAILSEESESEQERARMDARFHKRRVWVIDPIDGTRDFISGRDEFAVSVGLVENGKAVLGFVFNPARDYLLSGGESLGIFLNGAAYVPPPRAEFNPPLALPKLVVSRSEQKHGHLQFIENVYGTLANHTMGSIAYKLALVASGAYDLTISVKPKNEWDIAGGAALINAAKLEVNYGDFTPFTFNKINTESLGLAAGTSAACTWYRSLIS